jgi:UDPglucose 6-dehydrogenase
VARLCVFGEWHQAVVSSACLADAGHDVRVAVTSEAVAARLNDGIPPVHEPELPDLIQGARTAGRLEFTADLEYALRGATCALIAIDTPIRDDDTPELTSIFEAARRIGGALTGDVLLIVTAQVPVGTCEQLRDTVARECSHTIEVAHVPEFLRLGHAVRTFMEADRFIIGSDSAGAGATAASVYEPLRRPLLRMSLRSAEMAKHASNAFLAVSISFANEIADLCSALGADIDAVTAGMKLDRRIGPGAFLSAGLGFAGGTLGRDLRALQALAASAGLETAIADAAIRVNNTRGLFVRRELQRVFGQDLAGLRVAVLGLTYKPGTSTMRRSAALQIIRDLTSAGVDVCAYDPLAVMDDVVDPPAFERAPSPQAAAHAADAVVLVTEWDGLMDLDPGLLRAEMRGSLFIDTRNLFDPPRMEQHGFRYVGVGRSAGASAAPAAASAEAGH